MQRLREYRRLDNPAPEIVFDLCTTVNACRRTASENPLTLAEMFEQGVIEYVAFPEALKGKYQSFTQADISALRKSGYTDPFLTVEQEVERYLKVLLVNHAG